MGSAKPLGTHAERERLAYLGRKKKIKIKKITRGTVATIEESYLLCQTKGIHGV